MRPMQSLMEPVCLPTATEASIPSRPAEHEGPMGPCYLTAETRPPLPSEGTAAGPSAFAASEIERLLKVNQDLQRVARAQAVAWPPSPERPSAGGPAKAWDAEAGPWPRASQEWLSSSPLRQSRLGSLYASPGGFPEASGTLSAEKEALASKLKAEELLQIESVRLATQAEADVLVRLCTPWASRTSVDELLMTAARESANAPNRALKRRVRQRLHKKLGAILTLEEFERAKDRGPSVAG
ncbi:unnamed protein product [Durusdinium trenchii]|uniref:Uncharacterized protein n=1 Tax=Durusdinium trenchii TaxID=1381693 RepID=A0ABP0I9Y5_9DINO